MICFCLVSVRKHRVKSLFAPALNWSIKDGLCYMYTYTTMSTCNNKIHFSHFDPLLLGTLIFCTKYSLLIRAIAIYAQPGVASERRCLTRCITGKSYCCHWIYTQTLNEISCWNNSMQEFMWLIERGMIWSLAVSFIYSVQLAQRAPKFRRRKSIEKRKNISTSKYIFRCRFDVDI